MLSASLVVARRTQIQLVHDAPAIIGFVADQVSLRAGLLSIPIMGVTVLIFARVLPGRIRPAH
ncbi:MAG: hypothetical protein ACTHZM_03845 [Canibacter sp.]